MTVPSVVITKQDFNSGVVRPSDEGVLAIIASSQNGTVNVAAQYMRWDTALTDLGYGPLVEYGAYDLGVAQKPFVAVKGTPSTSGSYGTVTKTGTGTFTPSAGSTAPYDEYDNCEIVFVNGGTLGTTGITYTYSMDGVHTSAVQALGTALSIVPPNTNTTIVVGTSAQTVVAGDSIAFSTVRPKLQSTDLTPIPGPLEALRTTSAPWEIVLVDGDADASMVSALDTWLATLETQGKFRAAIVNSRYRDIITPETESAYLTAMGTAFDASATIRESVCADAGDLTSVVTGLLQRRPTALALAARAMAIDVAIDAAYVADGPVDNFSILDSNGNAKYHDEYLHPGLDDHRLTALRSIPGETGAYINNPRVLSASGSDYVFLQHVRVMNLACETAFQSLTTRLSKGVRKQRKADPVTGAVYIVEEDALDLESGVRTALAKVLNGRVSGFAFSVSRTDDLSSNAGATITCTLAIAGLAYIKQFSVTAQFVKAV